MLNPEASKLKSYPLLDWLRYLLASVVVLGHQGFQFPEPINGSLAVAVFLALSGWLIGGILITSSQKDLPRFFYNRATRIWAPYFAAVTILYCVAATREGIGTDWFRYLYYDTTFTHYTFVRLPIDLVSMPLGGTATHFWSISVEEQFYLIAPLIMLFVARGKSIAAWLVITLVLMLNNSVFAPIAAGVCAAILNRDWDIAATLASRRWAALVATIAFAGLLFWNIEPWRSVFAVSLVIALTAPGRRGGLGLFAGGISYPLYLNHWMGAFVVNALSRYIIELPHALHVAASYVASVVAACIAWFTIDRQVMTWRDRLYTPTRGRALGFGAYALVSIGIAGGTALYLSGYR